MDLNKVIVELIRERDLLDEAIAHLEQLAGVTQLVSSPSPRVARSEKRQEKVRTAGGGSD
jgi:hypothetical protein